MARSQFDRDEILPILAATPVRMAELAAGASPAQLRARPAPDEWSAVEVLAHLRACADVWGDGIATILAEDHPTIQAINPMTWIARTDYPAQAFAPSLAAFTAQREALLAELTALPPAAWDRTATLVGAGKPLTRTVHGYADSIARHERPHLKQLARTIAAVRAAAGDDVATTEPPPSSDRRQPDPAAGPSVR